MLVELAVSDLGVISDLRLVFGPGMTAVTGETGAGKTLVVEAVELLLGARADGSLVRAGGREATVEGRFEAGNEELVLTRVVPIEGRSRAYVNGRMATATELAEIGATLVDLHGQNAHQSLLTPAVQREALDRFGGVDLGPLVDARRTLAEIDRQLAGLGGDAGTRAREMDLLRFQLDELSVAGLADPNEDELLDAEQDDLSAAVANREAAQTAAAMLSVDGPVGDALGVARAALDDRRRFEQLAARLRSLEAELTDLTHDIRGFGEAMDEDPERLAEIRNRRQLLHDLVRKYGTATVDGPANPATAGSLSHVIAYTAEVRDRLADLDSHEGRVGELEVRRAAAVEQVAKAESRVGGARRRAAPRLAAAVELHLRQLAMARARVSVDVGDDPGDRVTFLLAANPGSEPRPLAKVASGGELARAMLALRLVLTTGPPVLVFDEVDAGIGGEAARAVGRALARVSADRQVLVVTHLPQVAAFADAQVVVSKRQDDDATVSDIGVVTGADRVVELSRMMTGSPDSTAAREHAIELLAVAEGERHRQRRAGDRREAVADAVAEEV